jgi:integrase
MSYPYKRGNVWWIRTKHPITRAWLSDKTPFKVDDPTGRLKAKRLAEKTQRDLDASASGSAPVFGNLTVRGYAEVWIPKRRELDLDWKNDRGRLDHHILSHIGDLPMAGVHARNIANLVHGWRTKPLKSTGEVMAPRTVRNAYSVLSALFRDAAIDGTIDQTPCILDERELGPVVDADPEWRRGAVYTREEAETLISHQDIPHERRLYYAFMLLAGMRPGEIAALRVRHYEPEVEPLGRLTVALALNTRKMTIKGTKTNAVREVPVHATLAAMLGEWLLSGYEELHGRGPQPDDLLLPLPPADAKARRSRKGEPIRSGDYAGKKWREVDLPMLGWRDRSMYDMKSTFITLCGKDRADRAAIKRVTHAPTKRDAFDGYDRDSHWDEMCEAIARLKIQRKRTGAKLVSIK